MIKVYLQAALGGVAAVLAAVAAVWPRWLESFAGLSPDAGSGETEWWLVALFAAPALALFLSARRSLGRAAPARA
jgi:hypothetical protein